MCKPMGFVELAPIVILCRTAFLIWPKGRPGEWSAKRDSISRSHWHWLGREGNPPMCLAHSWTVRGMLPVRAEIRAQSITQSELWVKWRRQ